MPYLTRATGPARASLAVCAPLMFGDADSSGYMRMFLESVCRYSSVNVDVVVDGDLMGLEAPDSRLNFISTRQFRWLMSHGNYDEVVYAMGNGPEYSYVYELLKEGRGILWLQEVRLTDFYRAYYSHAGRDLTQLPPELAPWARRYPEHETNLLERDVLTQHDQSIYLTGEVVSYARKVIVGSCFARELVEVDSAGSVPVVTLPAAAPGIGEVPADPWSSIAAGRDLSESDSLVLIEGEVKPQRSPEIIVDAFANVALTNGGLLLSFVGSCHPEYQRQLESRAATLGIENRVVFVSTASDSEAAGWAAAATVCVQLQYPSDGESPWRSAGALAAGIPTIVTEHGPLLELPDDAVMKLPVPVTSHNLAQAINSLLNDEDRAAGLRREARAYAGTVTLELVTSKFVTEVLGGA